jgi:hypothetical protein
MHRAALARLALFAVLLVAGGLGRTTEMNASGSRANDVFGGEVEVVNPQELIEGPDDPTNKGMVVVPGRVVWQWGDRVYNYDLSSGRFGIANTVVLKAADANEAFVSVVNWQPRTRFALVAVNYQTGSRRTVVNDHDDPWFYGESQVALDGDFAYFSGSSDQGGQCPFEAFYRVKRDGSGRPERLGDEPCGVSTPFLIKGGYVYWSQNGSKGPAALWRRQLVPDSPKQRLALTTQHHLPLALGMGRLFYIDADRIMSCPLDGAAPPVEHVRGLDSSANPMLLVDRGTLYWTNGRSIMRASLGGMTLLKPEMVADKGNYHGGPIATDGQHLYWFDRIHYRMLRVGRDAGGRLSRPALVARPGNVSPSPVDSADTTLLVGDGWGCAHVLGWRDRTLQCWRAESDKGPIHAKPVPWLAPPDLRAGPDRLCYLDRGRPTCWPWPDFTFSRPEGVPQIQGKNDPQIRVGGSFACSIQDVHGQLTLNCEGDNTYQQLLKPGLTEIQGQLRPWALGTWHGCFGRRLSCWGRGDGGQLGYVPDEKCQTGRGQVACSREPHEATSAPSDIRDMFTCAASNQWTAFSCWGASRDGWFGGEACSPALRGAWPVGGGTVKAPNATCSSSPASIPSFNQLFATHNCNSEGDALPPIGCEEHANPRYSVGPRGACMLAKGALRCVGAIATPDGSFGKVVVSQGVAAGACGLAKGSVLCWGEGYSPSGQPSTPVPIAFDQPATAVVDFPAPAKSSWSAKHLINRGCERIPLAFPKCPAAATGEPWSALAPKASELLGKAVTVKDRLVVGSRPKSSPVANGRHCNFKWKNPAADPYEREGRYPGTSGDCYEDGRPIVLGQGDSQLGFAEDSPAFDCIGDESRLCCGAQAFGQTAVVQGILDGSDERGWVLKSASVCELP